MQPTVAHKETFRELETIVDNGIKTFLEVGRALLEIRSRWAEFRKEAGYNSFDIYCQERWGMRRDHADRIIAAHKTVLAIEKEITTKREVTSKNPLAVAKNKKEDASTKLPTTENQVRELKKLPKAERTDAWLEVIETVDNPTAKDVRAVVEKRKEQTEIQRQEIESDPAFIAAEQRRETALERNKKAYASLKTLGFAATFDVDKFVSIAEGDEIDSALEWIEKCIDRFPEVRRKLKAAQKPAIHAVK